MNALADTTSTPRRGIKIPMPVFAALIALLAIVAGWLVYDQVFRVQDIDKTQYESLYTPSARARERFIQRTDRPPPANAGIGILTRGDGFDLQIVGARARFTRENNEIRLNARFIDNSLFNGSDRVATGARFRALQSTEAAAAANVTPEQIEKLRQIDVPREMSLPEDARNKLLELGRRYDAAPEDQRQAIETEMTEHFRAATTAALQPTVAAYSQSAKQVREVLTEQQIASLRNAR